MTQAVALTGTEKQIEWAEKLRTEWITKQAAMIDRWRSDLAKDPARAARLEPLMSDNAKALDLACRQTSAAWWIDTRSASREDIKDGLLGTYKIPTITGRAALPVFVEA